MIMFFSSIVFLRDCGELSCSTYKDIGGYSDDDNIFGGAGYYLLFGNDGDDKLWGGDDNDYLYGGPNIDSGNGGPGDDFCNDVEIEES
jgi:Ca2+-binding RTX toxin-like protein